MRRFLLATATISFALPTIAQEAVTVEVKAAFLNAIDEAEVPARESGVLSSVRVRVGKMIRTGDVIGTIDDELAKLDFNRARLDAQIAGVAAQNPFDLESAQAQHREARLAEEQAKLAREIAAARAGSDVAIRDARKSSDLAQIQLDRAKSARAAVRTSVSQTEIDRLELSLQRTELEVEKAELEKSLAELTERAEDALLREKAQIVKRLELSIRDAETQSQAMRLTHDRYASVVDLAQARLKRHTIASPIDGMVVEVSRHQGEWVEPGRTIARVVRIDRLYAEGYVDASSIGRTLENRPVRISFDRSGRKPIQVEARVSFVSPEFDRANRQFRVRAEFENPGLLLKPGMLVRMEIAAGPE